MSYDDPCSECGSQIILCREDAVQTGLTTDTTGQPVALLENLRIGKCACSFWLDRDDDWLFFESCETVN